MNQSNIQTAAAILWRNWNELTCIDELPPDCRPRDRAEGYAIQAELARLSRQPVAGWKIAATSLVGQKHIGVEGPLAGRLLAGRVFAGGANVPLEGNRMRVAEAEFAFRFCKPLPKRDEPYGVEEVLLAVESLHPAIEIPDSRYADFARAGAPQLIADDACACWFLLGEATGADWRVQDLVSHRVEAHLNEKLAETGSGEKVMGDPRVALAWIANELCVYGDGLKPGEFVTTGTCITPVPISGGDSLRADFGEFGAVEASFAG